MNQLNEAEIAEAAREAGVSPVELQRALARRAAPGGTTHQLVKFDGDPVEVRLPAPLPAALQHVRGTLEEQTGARGHMQGEEAFDLLDAQRGVVYRAHGREDGAGGSLIKVAVDPTPARSKATLVSLTLAAGVALISLASLLFAGTGGAGMVAAFSIVSAIFVRVLLGRKQHRALKDAHHHVHRSALMSEEQPVPALAAAPVRL